VSTPLLASNSPRASVLVTNCTRNSGMAVLRALGRSGWRVAGADDRLLPMGLRSRYTSLAYETLPPEDAPAFGSTLLELLDRMRPDVLIPTRGIEAACHSRAEILSRARSLLPTVSAFQVLHDKSRLLKSCAELGITVPRTFELEEARTFLARQDATLVVKPCRDIGGGAGVHFVKRPEELDNAWQGTQRAHGRALICEYIPGPTENLRALHVLFDAHSRLVGWFTLRKSRLRPAKVGVSVAAVSTHEWPLVASFLPLFAALGWQGPADIELKIDERDGRAVLIEINPRFSGAIHFPIACGVNFPDLYCRAACGESLPASIRPDYPAGIR
jgi:predicted ATP-grasp superfamily ATP-dependent carboligase